MQEHLITMEKTTANVEEIKQPSCQDALTPKLALMYSSVTYVDETESYRTYRASSNKSLEIHTIRVLNVDSTFYKSDPDRASTLFVQELLRLCSTSSEAVSVEAFEIHGNRIAYATKYCQTLQQLLDDKTSRNGIDLDKLLKHVLDDVSFLLSKLQISNHITNIELESINYIKSTHKYFLSDWGKNTVEHYEKSGCKSDEGQEISDGAEEIFALGMKIMEYFGVSKETLKELEAETSVPKYNDTLTNALAKVFSESKNCPPSYERIVKRMLSRDPTMRMTLENFEAALKQVKKKQIQQKLVKSNHEVFSSASNSLLSSSNQRETQPERNSSIDSVKIAFMTKFKPMHSLLSRDGSWLKEMKRQVRLVASDEKAAASISSKNFGTLLVPYEKSRNRDNHLILAINAMVAYDGKSLDELRSQDYNLIRNPNSLPDNLREDLQSKIQRKSLSYDNIEQSLRCSEPANIRAIDLSWKGISDEEAETLSKTCWPNLTTLELPFTKLSDLGITALSKNNAWVNLRILNLEVNNIGPEGALALSSNVSWTNLKKLQLRGNNLGDEGATALSRNASWTNLQALGLEQNEISWRGAKALALNSSWASLKKLHLDCNAIAAEGALALSNNTSWKNLRTLGLEKTQLSCQGVAALSTNSSWVNLKTLYLSFNSIGAEGAAVLGKNSSWRNLQTLGLNLNNIDDQGVKALSLNVSWTNLKHLNLSDNNITAEGAAALSENVSWGNLLTLYLASNQIDDQGLAALSKNTSWTKLGSLILYNNPIGKAGVIALLSNNSWANLNTLDLCGYRQFTCKNSDLEQLRACLKARWPSIEAWLQY